jgi:hypothetical protein
MREIKLEPIDGPLAVAEEYIWRIHNGDDFKKRTISEYEKDCLNRLNDDLLVNGYLNPGKYVVGVSRGLLVSEGGEDSATKRRVVIDQNVLIGKMLGASILKINRRDEEPGFRALCFVFYEVAKVAGDDFDYLPDELPSTEHLFAPALDISKIVPIQH